jgi:uncharacterized protein (TIGR02996 family)
MARKRSTNALDSSPQAIAFLADIVEHPEDDAPRLVYADWLEDNGDPDRAEFIRVQVEGEPLPEGDPVKWERETRAAELLARRRKAWTRELPEWAQKGEFRRGFLEEVETSVSEFVEGAEVFARHPLVHVRLSGGEGLPAIKALAECPHLAGVRHLSVDDIRLSDQGLAVLVASRYISNLAVLRLGYGVSATGLKALADSPHLGRLTALTLGGGRLWPAAGEILGQSRSLKSLTDLDLSDSGIDLKGLRALVDSPLAKRLKHLDLSVSFSPAAVVGAEGAQILGQSPILNELRFLNLHWNKIGDGGLEALAQARSLHRLEHLDLTNNQIHAEGMAALGASRVLANLRHLVLRDNYLHDSSIVAFAASRTLTKLACLHLQDNRFGAEGAQALAECPALSALTELNLANNRIDDEGARALAKSTNFANLRHLDLSENQIGPAGAKALAGSPHLRRLETLRLEANHIGDAGAKALARSAIVAGLVELNLQHNGIGDAGAKALAASAGLARLQDLLLRANSIGVAGARALAKAPHLAGLRFLRVSHNPLVTGGGKEPLRERFGKRVSF